MLRRLERQWARRAGGPLPIKILTYGAWPNEDDGLYHGDGRTYTEEEKTALEAEYQLIIFCFQYGDWPPGDGKRIQMTWGDDDDGQHAATA